MIDEISEFVLEFLFPMEKNFMSCELEDYVNPEQLLDFAFELLHDDDESKIAHEIIAWYTIHSDPSVLDDEERFQNEINLLIARGILRNLVEFGLMSFDFENNEYSLTRFGKRMRRQIRRAAKCKEHQTPSAH